VAALHLVPAGPLDDRHDLSSVLVPPVALGMLLQPTSDELGRALGEAVFLDQLAGRLLWGLGQTEAVVVRSAFCCG
jgi:hypothetical protein